MATGGRKPTAERLQAENDFLRRGGIVQEIGKTVRFLLVAAATVGIVYLLGHSIEALAGKQTEANILVSLLGTLEVSVVLSWVVGGAGVAYGRAQNKLRKTTVERLHKRIHDLESAIDQNRSSSKLTPRGDTNPEDA